MRLTVTAFFHVVLILNMAYLSQSPFPTSAGPFRMQMWVCSGSDNAVCLHMFVKYVYVKIYVHVCVCVDASEVKIAVHYSPSLSDSSNLT